MAGAGQGPAAPARGRPPDAGPGGERQWGSAGGRTHRGPARARGPHPRSRAPRRGLLTESLPAAAQPVLLRRRARSPEPAVAVGEAAETLDDVAGVLRPAQR